MPAQPSAFSRPNTSRIALAVAPGDWAGLARATLAAWHQQVHLRAGQQRVSRVRLALGAAWTRPGRHQPRLQALARQLAQGDVPVDVLVLPTLSQPELRLGWAPWHAPPAAGQPAPRNLTPPLPGEPTMKLPFFSTLFDTPAPVPAHPAVPDEPGLEPMGVRSAPGAGKQLSKALAQIADLIATQEVRELLELDTVGCRYQLWTLTFWVTAANQPALRGLIDVSQRDAGVAKTLVERGFAKAEGARWLNTLRLKLEFKRGDSLPREASEVLVVCGRDSVTLPFSYTGQIELGEPPAHAPGVGPDATVLAPTARAAAGAELLLWGQLPGRPTVSRWRFATGPLKIGADEDAALRIEHRYISGEHLALSLDAAGFWQVEDRSRNGSSLFDASADEAESPLPYRQVKRLPASGALRLGPSPDDPVLSFQVLAPARAPGAGHDGAAPAARGRVTQLARVGDLAAAQPARRSTGLA